MKKLFLVLLFFSLSITAQKAEQYVVEYDYIMLFEKGKKPKEYEATTRVFFNYNNIGSRIKIYYFDKIYDFIKVGNLTEGQTKKGEKFKGMMVIDQNKTQAYIQLFEKDGTLRLIFTKLRVEFYN